ncbi:hypothetical protein F5148DRAFT_734222 [Russula earlei]|uniref:Uncharacterized protein n=1 Tax=Russula earlei TaxID=71964 RepID=A0ACC0UNI6_9AGAM|nr:hypothetical protein F5148DRAFT_734222 [Russula earlei]
MSSQASIKTASGCESQCPICGVTLSRPTDINRHRKTKHPDGTETKFSCPWPGCQYETMQKGNLKTHLAARHSGGPKYPCAECGRRFNDAAARLRHRKKVHGYEPYHTEEYVARQALKEKEKADQGAGEKVPSTSRRQRAASAAPSSVPSSSATVPRDVLKLAYHNDFWKMLIDVARSSASQPADSGDCVQHGLPSATLPGYDAPESIQSLPQVFINPTAQSQPSSLSDLTTDYSGFAPLSPHGQAFMWPTTQDTTAIPAIPLDSTLHFPNNTTPFPHSGGPLTFPQWSWSNDVQDIFTQPLAFSDISSLIPTHHNPDSLLEPGLGPTWTAAPTAAVSSPPSQLDIFMPGQDANFDAWCHSNI